MDRTVNPVSNLQWTAWTLCSLFLFGLTISGCGPDPQARVTVEGGDQARRFVPVSAEIELPTDADLDAPACMRDHTGERFAAQVEPIDGAGVRVWWVVDFLASGNTKTYDFHLGRGCGERSYTWGPPEDTTTTLTWGERPVLEYVHPTFDPADVEHTKKPFHHVFSPDGSRRITKGSGGLYSHHRGLFFGYNQVRVDGDTLDVWHAADGEHQQHAEVTRSFEGPVMGGHAARIQWNDREGEPFAEEQRTLRTFRQPDGRLLVEFETTVRTLVDTVHLEGDRQHAGVQFRAVQAVAQNAGETRFLRPEGWEELPPGEEINDEEHVDLPWNAIQFSLDSQPYTVAYLTDPSNPEGAFFSERRYGRFGEYFPWTLTEETPLHARYRWLVVEGAEDLRDQIVRYYRQLGDPVQITVSG